MRYIVKHGDTIASVAYSFGIRPFDLLLHNPSIYSEQSYLPVGCELIIPEKNATPSEMIDCLTEFGHRDLERLLPQLEQDKVIVEEIGYSVMNKPLYALAVGRGEKEIFYSGGWHANEWHTSKFLALFLKRLAQFDRKREKWFRYDVANILDEITLYVVPLVNPDGVDLVLQGVYEGHPYRDEVLRMNKGVERFEHWSSNIRGVDLNHQWPAGWKREADESPQQAWSRHYSGQAPLTEPEAIAIHQFTCRHAFEYVLAFHSQGQLIYWGYEGLEPKESGEMAKRLSLVSSYTPIRTADSDAGYKDWFIQEMRKPGFTIEVGVGTNPLPPSAFAEVWSNNILLALEGLTLDLS